MIRRVSGNVTDTLQKKHGLEAPLAAWTASALTLDVCHELGHINLRGDPKDKGFRKGAEDALGQALPIAANTISEGELTICWLGPDEWLVLANADAVPTLTGTLETALAGHSCAINDLSGGQLALRLSGGTVRETLAKGCTLDFHPSMFAPGMCAQSGLAKANVTLICAADPDEFLIVVRRSYSDYLLAWLQHAA